MSASRENVSAAIRNFIVMKLLRGQEIELTDDTKLFTTRRVDSFGLAELGVFIESEFGVYIPDADLTSEKMDTIGEITDRVLRDTSSRTDGD